MNFIFGYLCNAYAFMSISMEGQWQTTENGYGCDEALKPPGGQTYIALGPLVQQGHYRGLGHNLANPLTPHKSVSTPSL